MSMTLVLKPMVNPAQTVFIRNKREMSKNLFDPLIIEGDGFKAWTDAFEEFRILGLKRAEELTKTQNHYIFDFFGSIENFIALGHLFLIEEGPVEIEHFEEDLTNSTTITFSQQFRIRPKTPEELLLDSKPLTKKQKKQARKMWPKSSKPES